MDHGYGVACISPVYPSEVQVLDLLDPLIVTLRPAVVGEKRGDFM